MRLFRLSTSYLAPKTLLQHLKHSLLIAGSLVFIGGLSSFNIIDDENDCSEEYSNLEYLSTDASLNCSPTDLVHWDLEACYSTSANTSPNDYSELNPVYPSNGGCDAINATNIYRNQGFHSCTEGASVGNSIGMCIGIAGIQEWADDDNRAIRFDYTVDPTSIGYLTEFKFYEKSPPFILTDQGNLQSNNYPQSYGIRILKNGVEVFKQINISTTQEWSLETFDFTNNPDFVVTSATTFSFELLPYHILDSNGNITAWDVDDFTIQGYCGSCPEICDNHIDDDGDGDIDEADSDCCLNVNSGGQIGYDEYLCGSNPNSSNLVNVTSPSGGNGEIEYLWLSSTTGCPDQLDQAIPGGTGASYYPGPISQTTWYVRCSRRVGCASWDLGESNCIKKEVTGDCGSGFPETWSYGCDDNINVELIGQGIKCENNATINIPNPGNVTQIYAEVVYKGQNINPSFLTFNTNVESVTVAGEFTSPPRGYYYRTILQPAPSVNITIPDGNKCEAQSILLYVFRNDPNAGASSGQFVQTWLYHNSTCETLPIELGPATRDIEVTVPLSEITNDGRIVNITATAAGVSKTITINNFNQGNSLNITPFVLENVPASASSVEVCIESPTGNPDGQSLVFSGAIKAEPICLTCSNSDLSGNVNVISDYNGQDISCQGANDGRAEIAPAGGLPPYTFQWSNGQSGQIINNLAPGTYTVTLTDNYDCSVTGSVTINEPAEVNLNVNITSNYNGQNISCNNANDGEATAQITGGTPPYSYNWTNGQTTATATGLSATTYSVIISDANGCTAEGSTTLTEPTPLDGSINISSDYNGQNISCANENDGSATANASGGTAPYTYQWSNNQNGATANNLSATTYNLTITDVNGCSIIRNVTLQDPPNLSIAAQVTSDFNGAVISCFGENDGAASATATGGTGNISYQWSNNQTGTTANNLIAGTYTVTATDVNGCTASTSVLLEEPDEVQAEANAISNYTGSPISCNGETDGSALVTTIGGVLPYSYQWSNNQTEQTATNLGAGSYSVTVTDANGCSSTSSVSFTEPNPITCSSGVTSTYNEGVDISTLGGNDGSASITTNGGTGTYTYQWDDANFQTTQQANNLVAGTYTVQVSDQNGCTCSATVTLKDPAKIGNFIFDDLNGNGLQDADEPGIPNVAVTLTGTTIDGTAITRNLTTDGNGMYDFDGLPAGSYKITVTAPADYLVTYQNESGTEATDSDIDPNNGMSDFVDVINGQYYPDLDAGFFTSVKIGDLAFRDCNKDGIQDADDEGLGFVPVMLNGTTGNGAAVNLSTTTDANGLYEFANLRPGTYVLTFGSPSTPSGMEFSPKDQGGNDNNDSDVANDGKTDPFTIKSGEDNNNLDAGYIDATAPSIAPIANDLIVQCDGNGNTAALNNWLNTNGGAQASDNWTAVADLTWTNDFTAVSDDCGASGSVTVTFTVSDECGNSNQTTATFTIEDNTAPNIETTSSNLEVECDGGGNGNELQSWLNSFGGASATDECSNVTWSNDFAGSLSDDCGASGSIIVTFTATDECGNESKTTSTFTIIDNSIPTIASVATDLEVECDGAGNQINIDAWLNSNGGALATDVCGQNITWSNNFNGISNDCASTGSATVSFTATDECGNIAQTTATFSIKDSTTPSIGIEANNLTVQCDGGGNNPDLFAWLESNGGAGANDNCSSVTWTNNFSVLRLSDDCGTSGSATVIFTATDECGNTSQTTATFTIEDNTAPVIGQIAVDQNVPCDGAGNQANLDAWLNSNAGALATDVCGEVTWSNDFSGSLSDDCGASGSATVTFTATDDCGNTSQTTATFTIDDNTTPNIGIVASDLTVECDGGGNGNELQAWLNSQGGAGATDICSEVIWSNDFSGSLSDDCGASGSTTVTFTASDDCGNTSQTTATFTIQDSTPPSITGTAQNLEVECDGQGNQINIDAWLNSNAGALASDVCGSNITWMNSYSGLSDGCAETGTATITFIASDECGNSSESTATLTIKDTTAPNIGIEAANKTVQCDGQGNQAELNDWLTTNGGAGATEICGDITWTNDFTSLSNACAASGSATVTFTATDDCGNAVATTATFTIEDNSIPTLIGVPENVTVECSEVPTIAEPTATDICDNAVEVTFNEVKTNGDCLDTYILTRTWTATDACSNQDIQTQIITVEDNTNPTLLGVPNSLTVECSEVPNAANPTVSDNCDLEVDVVFTEVRTDSDCGDNYVLTRTWTATDNCGNQDVQSQVITVEDTTMPEMAGVPGDFTVECDFIPPPAEPNAIDNCDNDVDIAFAEIRTNGNCAENYTLTRTWTATDNCGNQNIQTQIVTVQDTSNPSLSGVPGNIVVECDVVPAPAEPSASDNCDTDVTIAFNEVQTNGACASSYVLTRTWTATDNCGNQDIQTQTITVQDQTIPTLLNVPGPITVECDAIPTAAELIASDNCDLEVQVTFAEQRINGVCADTYTLNRTWTATDDCGNQDIQTQVITVEDNSNPELIGVPEALTIECDAVPAPATPSANDNCDTEVNIAFTEINTSNGCAGNYTLTRTWTATDNCGNQDVQTQIITVEDTTNPSLLGVPLDATVECDQVPTVPVIGTGITADDNCDTDVQIAFNEVRTNGNCQDTYTLTRTWTATDDCGNQDVQTQTIVVEDNTNPELAGVPASITVECDAIPDAATLIATDNCDADVDIAFTEIRTNGNCQDTYILTRTWTATDNCGNQDVQTQIITVEDNTSPSLLGVPADATAECDNIPVAAEPTATDNCDTEVNIVFNETQSAGSCTNNYVLTRTWTATDNCGNQDIQTQIITVEDNTDPSLLGVPADVTVECDNLPVVAEPTATDNCDTDVLIFYNEVRTNGPCADSYTLTRSWTATDNCGNTAVEFQVITVQDTTMPEVNGVPADITVECDQIPSIPAIGSDVLVTDNCDANVTLTFNEVKTNGPCADSYTLTRTWTASDACGNQNIQTQIITVQDETAPELIGVPADDMVECDAVPAPVEPTATDNCDTDVQIVFNEIRTNGSCINTYTLTRTWTATDNCGNKDIQTQVINVEDTTDPELTGVPADINVECDAIPAVANPTVMDNCDTDIQAIFSEVRTNGSCSENYTLTRTWSATDACGNQNIQTQVITVEDTTDPSLIGVPGDITVECDQVPDLAEPTATDNCDTDVQIVVQEIYADSSCLNAYTLTRVWTATDNCGNQDIQTQVITVEDNTDPILVGIPTDVTVECDAVPIAPSVFVSDNCDQDVELDYSEVRTNGDCADTYILTRTWTATDVCGNESKQTQIVTVQDTTDPELIGVPENETVECNAIPVVAEPTATDNCDTDVTITFVETATNGACPNSFILTRTWTATDNCGNKDIQTQTITVEDETAPELIGVPADETAECDAIPSPAEPTATDNCDTDVIISFNEVRTNGGCANTYTLTRTWTATDDCGNQDIQTQVITVEDTTEPELSGIPADETVECDAIPNLAEPTATDNCDADVIISFNEIRSNGACMDTYTLTRTWTATDVCGNKDTQTQIITVEDTTDPELSGVPADETVACDAIPAPAEPTATDNCSIDVNISFNEVQTNSDCANNYTLTRTWTATDNCGNQDIQTQVITVEDNSEPQLLDVPADETVECDYVPAPAELNATDNCDTDVSVTFNEVRTNGDCPNNYTLTRTWTASDACGNQDIQTQVITVEDTTDPELIDVPADETVECNAVPAQANPTATDNCDTDVIVTFNEVRTNGDCPNNYILTRTWTATDVCGNKDIQTQVITVEDTTDPELIGVPANMIAECNAIPNPANPTATDNCDTDVQISFEEIQTAGSCINNYTLTRIWTATDVCGNKDIQTRVITVEDDTEPSLIGVPGNETVECDAIPAVASPTATDNCDVDVQVSFNEVRVNGSCTDSYTLVRTWTATDACGNQAKETQTINVEDNTLPSLSGVPGDESVECDAIPTPANPIATDNCDTDVNISFNEVRTNGSCAENYILTRTWTATDNCGNQAKETQVINVEDTMAPSLDGVPADATVECDAVPTAPSLSTFDASDNCDTDVEITFAEVFTPGECVNNYTITRTWTATDDCGNQNKQTQILIVEDTQAPELIGVPADASASCGEISPPPAIGSDITATDNCDINVNITFNETVSEGNCAESYILTRTWTARDNCGNVDIQTQIITIGDDAPPALTGVPGDLTVECGEIPAPAQPTAIDDCATEVSVDFSEQQINGDCPDSYDLIRTWTAVDNCGNAVSESQTITVRDITDPQLIGVPADITADCNEVPDPATGDVTATDNCDINVNITFSEITTSGACANTYTITRTWTATDACGNQDIQTQVITVGDNASPSLEGIPSNLSVECDNIPEVANPTASDDCDANIEVDFTEVRTNGSCTNNYILTRTWMATDECGNTASGTQVISVEDNTAPELVGVPGNIEVGCNEIPPVVGNDEVTATDNCAIDVNVTFNEVVIEGACADTYVLIRTWTATDNCGNQDIQSQTITVGDNGAPEFTNVPEATTVECGNVPDPIDPIVTDDCSENVTITFNEVRNNGNCTDAYTLIRTWTATDNCGNQSAASQIITVEDNANPELIGVPADLTVDCSEVPPTPATVTATDNCDDEVQVTFNETSNTGSCAGDLEIIRTWTATDNCGNQDIQTQVITLSDDEAPVIESAPADMTVECDAIPSPVTLTATDDCDSDVEVTMNEVRTNGSCTHEYILTRTWTATDDCGKEDKTTQVITVQDTTDPILLDVPGNMTVNLSIGEEVPSVPTITATDNCSINVNVFFSESTTTNDCGSVILRIWTAIDNCGNSVSESQIISVTDFLSASIIPEESVICAGSSIQLFASPDNIVDYSYNWTTTGGSFDNTSIATPFYTNNEPGTYTVNVAITNDEGCSGSVSTTITVLDNSPGTIMSNGPLCEEDDLQLTVQGGAGNYTWTGPNGFTSSEQNPAIQNVTTSNAGTYFVSFGSGECATTLDIDVAITPEILGDFNKIPVSCDSLGAIFVGVIGGTGTYNYDWADLPGSDNPSDRTGLHPGLYHLTVSSGPCTYLFSNIEIIDGCGEIDCGAQAGTLTAQFSSLCLDGNPVSLSATPDGNDSVLPGFTKVFVLSAGQELLIKKMNNEPNFMVEEASPYKIHSLVYDPVLLDLNNIQMDVTTGYEVNEMLMQGGGNLCGSLDIQGASILVTQISTDITNQTADLCGSANGEITLSPATNTYLWSDGVIASERADLAAGFYDVLAMNEAGCDQRISLEVLSSCTCEEPVINNIVIVETTCGDAEGSASIVVGGNPSDFTYSWFPNTGTPNAIGNERTDLLGGIYSVTISDPNKPDCYTIEEFGIGNVDGPEPIEIMATPANCQAFNGTVTLLPETYNYVWLDNVTGNTRNDLAAGFYQVIVVNPEAPDCPNIAEVVIEETNELEVAEVIVTQPTCDEENGVVDITITGGEPSSVKFEWSDGVDNFESVRTDLGSGTYTVTVTQQTNLCQTQLTFVLTDDVIGANVVLTPDVVQLSCAGINDGTVDFSVSTFPGFAEPFTTIIEDGNGDTYVNGELGAGTYCLVVLDDNKCYAGSSCFDVVDPAALDVAVAKTNKTCQGGGSITLTIDGGNGGYIYDWADINGSSNVQNRNDLTDGIYNVTITDAEGCSVEINDLIVADECNGCDLADVLNVVVIEATCDNADGSATLALSGNASAYNYNWNPNLGDPINGNENARTNLPAGTYEVTIFNNNDEACSLTEIFTIGNADGPQANISTTPATCNAANGTAQLSPSNFQYTWSDGGVGSNRNDLLATTYQLTVTDSNTGCINVVTVVIEEENSLAANVVINNLPACEESNGSVTINILGGSGNYSYSWGASNTRDNLSSGIYTVEVFDLIEGCETEITFALTDDVVGATVDLNPVIAVSCTGENDAEIDFNVDVENGFNQPVAISIEDADGNVYTNGNLAPGNYCVLVRDGDDCLAGQNCFLVEEATSINLQIASLDKSCNNEGSIALSVNGGSGNYSFDWEDQSGSDNSEDRTNLNAGTYTVVVSDDKGCTAVAENIEIVDLCDVCSDPVINNIVVVQSTCNTASGSASINLAGDPSDYDFDWTPNVSNSNTANNLEAGIYTIVITDDGDDTCQITEIITVGNSDGPEVTSIETTPAACLATDGTAKLEPSNFTYTWSDNVESDFRDDLQSGTYQVIVSDPSTTCLNFITVEIEEDNDLVATPVINDQPTCGDNNGSVTIDVSGGTGDYNFSWGAGDTRSNLASGLYTIVVVDNSTGCETEVTFVLLDDVEGADIDIQNTGNIVTLSCAGESDGFVDFDVDLDSDFAEPAKIFILDANGNVQINGNLSAGTYCIIVRDDNDCLAAEECFEVVDPSAIDVEVSIDDVDCDVFGSINLTVSGGNGDYTFDWADLSGADNTPNRNNLPEGNYDLVVTDGNGCSVEINDISVDDVCTDCDDPVVSNTVIVEATCGNNNGQATVVIVGNPNNYDYEWEPNVSNTNVGSNIPGGTYKVTILDENNPGCQTTEIFTVPNTDGPEAVTVSTSPATCLTTNGSASLSPANFSYQWSDNGTGATRNDLPAGTYQITVTESGNDCQNFLSLVIEENNSLILEAIVNETPDCEASNGSVTIAVNGGSGDYSYSWGSSATQTDLGSGVYSVDVVDNETGCQENITFVLLDDVVGADIDIQNTDNTVTLNCIGDNNGEVNFDIDLDPGFIGTPIIEILDINGNIVGNGALPIGNYCVTVKDGNNCLAAQACFEVVEPRQIDVLVTIDDKTCITDGQINLSVTGDNAPYTFDWDDLAGNDDPQNRADLDAGFYDVTITDANGCTAVAQDLRVRDECDPDGDCNEPIVQSVVTVESQCDQAIGSAVINVLGDAADYVFTWTPDVSNSNTANNLEVGIYSVVIAEVNNPNCFTVEEFAIKNGNGPQAIIDSTTPATCDANNGTAVLLPVSFIYDWCNGAIGFNVVNLPSGTCFVTVTNPATGCSNILEVEIDEINTLVADAEITNQPDCGEDNGSVSINVEGGSTSYEYVWSDDGSGQDRNNLEAGVYGVTVSDNGDNACVYELNFVLTDDVIGGVVDIEADTVAVSCIGDSDGTVDFNFIADAGFAFPANITILDLGGNELTNGSLGIGNYCVVIRDANDCIAAGACFTVVAPQTIDLDIIKSNITCDTFGMIKVFVDGGNGDYTFDWADIAGSDNPQNRDSLSVGVYDLTVTDSKGCTAAVNDLIIVDECINCPSPDTVQISLPVNSQDIYCFELESCFDSLATSYTLLDGSLTGSSTFGNWVLGEDGCLTYSSSTTPGIGVDTICMVATYNGLPDTTCVIVTITADCNIYSGLDTLDAAFCLDLTEVCLDIPIETILNYDFLDNGLPYTNGFMGCNSDSSITYLVSAFLSPSTYGLDSWILNGDTFSIANFTDAEQVVDSMNVWDVNGNWMLNGILIEGGEFSNVYGDIVISEGGVVIATANPNIQLVPSGAAISLDTGFHQIIVSNTLLGCVDTLNLTINCQDCFEEAYLGPDLLEASDCDSLTGLCLELILDNIANFSITDNGLPYTGSFAGCNFDSLQSYLALGYNTPSFYALNSWQVNDVFFSMGNFTDVEELVDSMNVWDPNGNWMIEGLTIQGGDFSNEYGSIVVAQFGNVIATSEPNLLLLPAGVQIELDTGFHEVIVRDTVFGCLDTFSVNIICDDFQALPTDTIDLEILLGFTDTICIDTTVLPGIIDTIFNICETESGLSVDFNLIDDYCYEYTAVELGTDPACIVICDEENHCDTTILRVTVRPAMIDTFLVDIPFDEMDIYCVDTTELPGIIDTIYNFCEDASGEFVNFTINPDDLCITFEGIGLGMDTACIAICDDLGFCDTTIIVATTLMGLGEGPIAVDDDTFAIINVPIIIDVLGNDTINGAFIGVEILTPPLNGTAILNPDFTITYAPDRDFCEEVDSFTYVLFTSTGSDTATVTINVLCDELTIYSGFSPNGDGVNDVFTILGIEQFPDNEVWIYNRWGNEVFRTKAYSNSNGWDGTWDGQNLPDGTYFYLVDDGEGKQYSGYLQIHR